MSEKRNAERAIEKYGLETCLKAMRLNEVDGEGQHSIAIYLDLHYNAAGAAINAGRFARQACEDCVEIHGDKPSEWINKWPAGADWRAVHVAHLCDGCFDDRNDQADPMNDFNYVGSKWHY